MKKRTTQIALSIFILVQIVTMAVLMIGEIQLIQSGLEYRFQYLLILYIVIPVLLIGGVIEYFGFKMILKRSSILMLFPFLIAIGLFLALSYEGKSDPITLSYFVILNELIAILVFGYSLLKVIKQNTRIENYSNIEKE